MDAAYDMCLCIYMLSAQSHWHMSTPLLLLHTPHPPPPPTTPPPSFYYGVGCTPLLCPSLLIIVFVAAYPLLSAPLLVPSSSYSTLLLRLPPPLLPPHSVDVQVMLAGSPVCLCSLSCCQGTKPFCTRKQKFLLLPQLRDPIMQTSMHEM